MIKCLKKGFVKNFVLVLKSSSKASFDNADSNRTNNKSSFVKKASKMKTYHPDARRNFESIGLVLTDYQQRIYSEMFKGRDISIKVNNKETENILLKQIISTLAVKDFKDLQTNTIFIAKKESIPELIKCADEFGNINMVYVDRNSSDFFSETIVTTIDDVEYLLNNRKDKFDMKGLTIIPFNVETDRDILRLIEKETGVNVILFNSMINTGKRSLNPFTFNNISNNATLLENIKYYGMIVNNLGEYNMKYALTQLLEEFKNKKILICAESDKIKDIQHLKSENVDIQYNKDSKYEIIIEYPFINEKKFMERRAWVDLNNPGRMMITLFTQDKLQEINELKLNNYFTIEIMNLLSKFVKDRKEFEDISLLNGEKGYKTFLIYSLSSKQKEE